MSSLDTSKGNEGLIWSILCVFFFIFLAVFFSITVNGKSPDKGISLELKKQEAELVHLRASMSQMSQKRHAMKLNIAEAKKAASLGEKVKQQSLEVSLQQSHIEDLQNKKVDITQKIEKHLTAYRNKKRNEYIGKQWSELTTNKGQQFQSVKIKNITSVGLEILHQEGLARISFDDLEKSLQEEFAYDPELAKRKLEDEKRSQLKYLESVASQQPSLNQEIPIATLQQQKDLLKDYRNKRSILQNLENAIQKQLNFAVRDSNKAAPRKQQFINQGLKKAENLSNKAERLRTILVQMETELMKFPKGMKIVQAHGLSQP